MTVEEIRFQLTSLSGEIVSMKRKIEDLVELAQDMLADMEGMDCSLDNTIADTFTLEDELESNTSSDVSGSGAGDGRVANASASRRKRGTRRRC